MSVYVGVHSFIRAIFTSQHDPGGVFRYRMDGYSVASVAPLPDRHQTLTDESVEMATDGSLVVRFKRAQLETTFSRDRDACQSAVEEGDGAGRGPAASTAAAADTEVAAVECSAGANQGGMEWLDPSEEGVVLLWAYGRGAWPSYHDATGAFVLPRLTLEG